MCAYRTISSGLCALRVPRVVSTATLRGPSSSVPQLIVLPKLKQRFSTQSIVDRHSTPTFATRNLLSKCWIPSILARRPRSVDTSSAADLLERLGFFAKAYNGVYHCLPLGLRVQAKIERLLDQHMQQLGASKVSLSSLSDIELWKRSLRYSDVQPELFQLRDRKNVQFLLSPTHEEEVTNIAKQHVESWRDLPLRLYQISRKYRDEKRPRDGLLRAREFLMKDLYTFDTSVQTAEKTYDEVQNAYHSFFTDLKIPVVRAAASSGSMGGNMSHEYHVASSKGEDEVVSCSNCDYCANAEVAQRDEQPPTSKTDAPELPLTSVEDALDSLRNSYQTVHHEMFLTTDQKSLVIILTPQRPSGTRINIYRAKEVCHVDSSLESPYQTFLRNISEAEPEQRDSYQILYIFDRQLQPDRLPPDSTTVKIKVGDGSSTETAALRTEYMTPGLDLMSIVTGDECSKCKQSGSLVVQRTLELGHTFHLGERYSKPLNATIAAPATQPADEPFARSQIDDHTQQSSRLPLQMGCHGIGVSRLVAAIAETQKDALGLNWPRLMAPFELIVLPATGFIEEAREVYDMLSQSDTAVDCVIDDRDLNYGSKIRDAELIGYPIILTVGRDWRKQPRCCQLQWRRPQSEKINVEASEVKERVHDILNGY